MSGSWTFLSTHGLVLLAIASNPHGTQREIARAVGVTEKTVQKVVADLVASGHLRKIREGRRNRYELSADAPFRHSLVAHRAEVQDLIALLVDPDGSVMR